MIYSSFSSLRKTLGVDADLIENSEVGYKLKAIVMNLIEQNPSMSIAEMQLKIPMNALPHLQDDLIDAINQSLNARQIQIMQFLDRNQFIAVKKVMALFKTSEITANRDLRALFEKKLVLRVGQGRATQYTKRRAL